MAGFLLAFREYGIKIRPLTRGGRFRPGDIASRRNPYSGRGKDSPTAIHPGPLSWEETPRNRQWIEGFRLLHTAHKYAAGLGPSLATPLRCDTPYLG